MSVPLFTESIRNACPPLVEPERRVLLRELLHILEIGADPSKMGCKCPRRCMNCA